MERKGVLIQAIEDFKPTCLEFQQQAGPDLDFPVVYGKFPAGQVHRLKCSLN